MNRLLNISTYQSDTDLIGNNWTTAAAFLNTHGFDGFELYPVGDYPWHRIPRQLITGIHLRFFIILAPIWRQDRQQLINIFGDWKTVDLFYGGRDPEWIAQFYADQLDLACDLDCDYTVFHPVHCELDYIWDWKVPWTLEQTLDLCAEVVNEATSRSRYRGLILFENLWWPGSFRLDSPEEYDYLLSRVNHPHCGIALDTGHLLNKNPDLTTEKEAAAYLSDCLDRLGETARQIRTVHLTRSLSGPYIRKSRQQPCPFEPGMGFWEQLELARHHVSRIDRHQAFEQPYISEIFKKINPDHVVFEFLFRNMEEWERKIKCQKKALSHCLWPQDPAY